jgi:hypothetical protein
MDDRRVGVWVAVGSKIFSSPWRSERFWDPPGVPSWGVKLTTHPQLVPS